MNEPLQEDAVLPSLEREAANAAAIFLIQKSPDLCREFIQYMRDLGEQERKKHRSPSGGGRIRAGFLQWSDWMAKAMTRQGIPAVIEPPVIDPLERQLAPTPEPVTRESRFISDDPFEQQLLDGSRGQLPPPPKPTTEPEPAWEPTPDIEADLLKGVEEDEKRKSAERDFIFHVCSQADELLVDLVATEGKGLSELAKWPRIVQVGDRRAVLVQSFTVPFRGMIVRRDFKANMRPVVVRHQHMFIQADGQKLIRSKVLEPKRREFYVKALEYVNGMIFKAYIEAGKRDRDDLAAYYQVRNGEIEEMTEAEYRRAENLVAAGKDPLEVYKEKLADDLNRKMGLHA